MEERSRKIELKKYFTSFDINSKLDWRNGGHIDEQEEVAIFVVANFAGLDVLT